MTKASSSTQTDNSTVEGCQYCERTPVGEDCPWCGKQSFCKGCQECFTPDCGYAGQEEEPS